MLPVGGLCGSNSISFVLLQFVRLLSVARVYDTREHPLDKPPSNFHMGIPASLIVIQQK
jgi:hypothetical protein